jgi:hypothetical protein
MRFRLRTLLIVLALGPPLLAAVAHAAEPPNDADIRRLIVGKWHHEDMPVFGYWTYDWTYREDGTFELIHTSRRFGEEPTKTVHSGTWKVANGKVIETYKEPLDPIFPSSKTQQFTVLAINERIMDWRYTTDDLTSRRTRVAP